MLLFERPAVLAAGDGAPLCCLPVRQDPVSHPAVVLYCLHALWRRLAEALPEAEIMFLVETVDNE